METMPRCHHPDRRHLGVGALGWVGWNKCDLPWFPPSFAAISLNFAIEGFEGPTGVPGEVQEDLKWIPQSVRPSVQQFRYRLIFRSTKIFVIEHRKGQSELRTTSRKRGHGPSCTLHTFLFPGSRESLKTDADVRRETDRPKILLVSDRTGRGGHRPRRSFPADQNGDLSARLYTNMNVEFSVVD